MRTYRSSIEEAGCEDRQKIHIKRPERQETGTGITVKPTEGNIKCETDDHDAAEKNKIRRRDG